VQFCNHPGAAPLLLAMSKNIRRFLILTVALLATGTALLFFTAHKIAARFEPEIRRQATRYLEQRFNSRVTLGNLQIGVPAISPFGLLFRRGRGTTAHVEGGNLSLRFRGRPDAPPLFAVESFSFDLDLGELREPRPRISSVALVGMTLTIPPRADLTGLETGNTQSMSSVIIDRLDLSNTRFTVLPKAAGRKPFALSIQTIHLQSAGVGQRMKYQADFTNPRPPGQIQARGSFGPWNRDDPGGTTLDGDYEFSNADLGVFKGIAGMLHSTGHFAGSLSAVKAQGKAFVPDFRLSSSGNKVPLETRFDAIIDGTNGNTVLQPVHARLLNTEFQTSGAIVKHEGKSRRAINLSVAMPAGHIEDLLLLAVKGKPFMSGLIRMQANISIPALEGSVQDKLLLDGSFDIARGEFANENIQGKIDELSRRGQGEPGDTNVADVFSHMAGTFHLEDQIMTFKQLNFQVPGAAVGLHGQYRLPNDALDFHGTLELQATISQTLQGWKRWLAKPIDPFFEKNGVGTFLKIQVVGSAKKPEFGRDKSK